MAYDINHCRFTGTIQQIKPIQTRSGIAMTQFRIQCFKEQIRCVAFREVANEIVQDFETGDRIGIRGRVESSNYEAEGVRVYSYQVNVSQVDSGEYESMTDREQEQKNPRPGMENVDYSGGPF